MLGASKFLVLLHCVSGGVLADVSEGVSCTADSETATADFMFQRSRTKPEETEPISETNASIHGSVFDLIKTEDLVDASKEEANCRIAVTMVSPEDEVKKEEMMNEVPKTNVSYQIQGTSILILEYGDRTDECCKAKAYLEWSDFTTQVSFNNPAPTCRQVTRFDCARNGSLPLQIATLAGTTSVRHLDIVSGEYKLLFEFPPSIATPQFAAINACAINPMDAIIYCSMDIDQKGSFLVRINDGELGYVAKLPGSRYAAAFDEDGTYYFSGYNSFSFIKKAHDLKTLESWKDFEDQKHHVNISKPFYVHMGGDMAVLEFDLEDTLTYLVSIITGGKLRVVRVFPQPTATWLLPTEGLPDDAVFGTAWNFKSGIYFAADTGDGVYKLDQWSINIKKKGPVRFTKVGNATPSEWNDGMSCMDADGPF